MAEAMKKFFPDTLINTVNGWGTNLTKPKEGAWVIIHKNDAGKICCAEVYSEDESEYAEIGLWFDGNNLSDYDGVFNLPMEVIECLREMGCGVDAEFEE